MLIYEKTHTQAPFNLTIEKEGVGGVTGKSPTVAMRDATTLTSYLDFSDSTFKTSGWTTKYLSMSEVERGHYTATLDLSSIVGILVGSILSMEYHVDDGLTIVGDDQETLLVVETIVKIATDTAALISAGGTGLTPSQAIWLQEIWKILGLDLNNPLVVSKTARNAGSGLDQAIETDVPVAGSVKVTRQ